MDRNLPLIDITRERDAFTEVFYEMNRRLRQTDYFLTPNQGEFSYSGDEISSTPNQSHKMLCMMLPKEMKVKILNSPLPGHVRLQVKGLQTLKVQPNWNQYQSIEKWLDNKGFITQTLITEWLQEKLNAVFNELKNARGEPILCCGANRYIMSVGKSTQSVSMIAQLVSDEDLKIEIDMLPCFTFKYPNWPETAKIDYADLFVSEEWFAVAQKSVNKNYRNSDRFWQMVFPAQENEILFYHPNVFHIMRFIRQICFSYRMNHIRPYLINTVMLWEIFVHNEHFWNNRLSYLYMHVLRKIQERLRQGNIPFFWDPRQNLIAWMPLHLIEEYIRTIDRVFNAINDDFHRTPFVKTLFSVTNPYEEFRETKRYFFYDYRKKCFRVSYVYHSASV